MKTKPCHLEIVAVLLLSVIPWPGPTVFKISCPRDRASVVRRIVQKRWIPILKKYQVELPLECPFHETRDIFHPQQAAKFQHRTSQWTCGLCGKSFYAEKHLDAHFDSRHKSNINMAEDAVCLANYCDIMRCDVLGSGDLDSSLIDDPSGALNTDIQVWRESTQNRRSSSCECRELARIYASDKSEIGPAVSSYNPGSQRHCKRGGGGGGGSGFETSSSSSSSEPRELSGSSASSSSTSSSSDSSSSSSSSTSSSSTGSSTSSSPSSTSSTTTSSSSSSSSSGSSYRANSLNTDNESSACDNPEGGESAQSEEDEANNLVESSLPAALDKRERSREFEIRRLKSNCKPEELQKLKLQCEILVRDCIAGLLANLSVKDFQEIEGELNRAICWYLSCDKYWEDSRRPPRHTPWYLLITFLLILSTCISACYYIISMLLNSGDDGGIDSNEESQDYNEGPDRGMGSLLHDPSGDPRSEERRRRMEMGDPRLAAGEMPDHYIYVAYPPELERRLVESCYNRTTRL